VLSSAVTLALLLIFVACKTAPNSDSTASGNHFRVNLGTEPPSLDWSLATDGVSFNVIANLMVGLTEFTRDLKPAPVIAKSWDVADGGKRIIFHLRDDVLWSDGQKVRAQDFEYSWRRLLNPKTASEYAYILFDIVNAQEYHEGKLADSGDVGVRALDDVTLEVRLRHSASYFLSLTTFEVTFPRVGLIRNTSSPMGRSHWRLGNTRTRFSCAPIPVISSASLSWIELPC
jgi:oligopeptide transport system substrate-binding protein